MKKQRKETAWKKSRKFGSNKHLDAFALKFGDVKGGRRRIKLADSSKGNLPQKLINLNCPEDS